MGNHPTISVHPSDSQTAVLVFSRSAAEEASSKPLSGNRQLNLSFYKNLIRKTEKLVEDTGLPGLWLNSNDQNGKNFGEKLANAFEEAFKAGYTSIIAIGNDCPSLSKTDILAAKSGLLQGKAILGPAKDGGTWLIGLTAEQYNQLSFRKFPWKTADLYAAMTSALRKRGFELHTLDSRSDIDRRTDLAEVLRDLDENAVIRNSILLLLHLQEEQTVLEPVSAPVLWTAPRAALRAPPIGC